MTFESAGAGAIGRLLSPQSIAVIGASADPTRIGGRPIAYMLKQGYAGELYPVNPGRDSIQGLRSYASVTDLPAIPDLAIVAVPAAAVFDTIEALGGHGVRNAVLFSAGFAEIGEAGIEAQARLAASARRHGLRLLGPNSLGLFNANINAYATFSTSLETGFPTAGRIAIASQSGAYGSHIFAAARARNIGTPILVTTGNEADITLGEVIMGLVEDDDTDVIVTYAEGIRDGDTFIAALRAAHRARKPIVMMKVGRSAAGAAAAQSHTAALTGADDVADAVFNEFGVVRARTTEEMLDIAMAATRRIYPVHNTLGMLTVSGGAGVIVSDAADTVGLEMPPLPDAAQAVLRTKVPFAGLRNPVDCTAQILNDTALVQPFAEAMVESGYSSIMCFFSQAGGAPSLVPSLRREFTKIIERYPDRLWVLSVLASPEIVRDYESDGFLVFEDPSRAVVAMNAMGQFGAAFARAIDPPSFDDAPVALPEAELDEATAKALLGEYGIASAPERACADADEAVAAADAFGYPVVLKILSPDILHKSEIGGVLLNVATPEAVREGYATVLERAGTAVPGAEITGVLVAKQVQGGVECLIGIQRDPVFGPIAVFGLGGIFVEVMKDVVFRRCPFDEVEAKRMIGGLRSAALLEGVRGQPRADIPALARILSRVSRFAVAAGPRLRSIDLNPVTALAEGQGAFALDALIEIDAAHTAE